MSGLEAKQRSTPTSPASTEDLRQYYLELRARHGDALWVHSDGAELDLRLVGKSERGPDGSIFACPTSLALYWDVNQAFVARDRHVLVVGERGVGKEVVARIIAGEKRSKLVSVNCATLTPSIAEALLFGIAPNAGVANAQKGTRGFVEEADGGVLFLDEFLDADGSLFPKLLRLLEQREWSPVGDPKMRKLDRETFIVAATNRVTTKSHLYSGEQVPARADLIDRFDVALEIAPLRVRKQEIPALATSILERACREKNIDTIRLDQRSMNALRDSPHSWAGNVRELRRLLLQQLRLRWSVATESRVLEIADETIAALAAPGLSEPPPDRLPGQLLPAWTDRAWLDAFRLDQLVAALRLEMLKEGRRAVEAAWVAEKVRTLLSVKNAHQALKSGVGLTASEVAAKVNAGSSFGRPETRAG